MILFFKKVAVVSESLHPAFDSPSAVALLISVSRPSAASLRTAVLVILKSSSFCVCVQNRPSVITCAPANNRNCNLSHCPVSHNGCSSLPNNYRKINSEFLLCTHCPVEKKPKKKTTALMLLNDQQNQRSDSAVFFFKRCFMHCNDQVIAAEVHIGKK